MPVNLTCFDPYRVTWSNLLYRAAFQLHASQAGLHMQPLSYRMRMPGCARTRLK